MAIIRLDCNLNGGDSVTPNNELFYRIYGDVDAYTVPIHTTGTALSDANVTVNGDGVIITGVDGTTNTSFKIAAVDGAGNEGVLSDVFSGGYKIIFVDNADAHYIYLPDVIGLETDGDYVEMKIELYDSAVTQYLLGNSAGPKIQYDDAGSITVFNDAGTNLGVVSGYPPEGSHELMVVRFTRNGSNLDLYKNGSLQGSVAVTGTLANFQNIGRFSTVEWQGELHEFTIKQGATTEFFACNEGTGSAVVGDNGTACIIAAFVDDSVWVAL